MTTTASPCLLVYTLTKTTRRLTFDILSQCPSVTYDGDDDGPYFKFTASNGYEVISRSRMDIQTERLWLLGARRHDESRSGSMVFSSNQKRDEAFDNFEQAINEWAAHHGGHANHRHTGPHASPTPPDERAAFEQLIAARLGSHGTAHWPDADSEAYRSSRVQDCRFGWLLCLEWLQAHTSTSTQGPGATTHSAQLAPD